MTDDAVKRQRKRRTWVLGLVLFALFLAIAIVPPLVSINHYKARITHLMSESVGRPVRLSSVGMRVLPTPGFVLNDLTIEEDPAFGAEPVLHANTVVATIRLGSLWRGRLEIGRISVDDASLNLVRTPEGLWNLDPLFRTAAQKSQSQSGVAQSRIVPLPYLEATNSRINIMRGTEKLPFSLVNTDLSFWQESPGEWRIRLKGEPSRTDQSLELSGSGDTGVVRLEASLRRAPELRQMPLHLDLEWRDAQVGQLTRLALGSDAGWRGNLTGDVSLDGTLDAAQIKTRLRAENVHRAEFAPADTLDFDARCSLLFHFSWQSVDDLVCDSPLGDGHVRLSGDLPREGKGPHFTLELDKISAGAALDAMRTVRNGIGRNLEAKGTIAGKIVYNPDAARAAADQDTPPKLAHRAGSAKAKAAKPRAVQGPLTGSLIVEGLQLSGDGLSTPVQAPKILFQPAVPAPDQHAALVASVGVPLGGASPMTIAVRLSVDGYQVTLRGLASLARARELGKVARASQVSLLDPLAGEPVAVDLSAEGPWIASESIPVDETAVQNPVGTASAVKQNTSLPTGPNMLPPTPQIVLSTDRVAGTISLHNANWKADYLANAVMISQATLHIGGGDSRWDPVDFTYGPVKGTAILTLPANCVDTCTPHFAIDFGALDAGALQAAILGAHAKGTLLSELIVRLNLAKSSVGAAWPRADGTATAETLLLGPLTLHDATAALSLTDAGAEITSFDATVLEGNVHGTGAIHTPGGDRDKPSYTIEAALEKLNPAAVGELAGSHWRGGEMNGDGKVELAGFTSEDLTSSAHGTLHFEWKHGSVAGEGEDAEVPKELAHFDRWTATAEIANGAITLKDNTVKLGARKAAVDGALAFGDPAKLTLAAPKETQVKREALAKRSGAEANCRIAPRRYNQTMVSSLSSSPVTIRCKGILFDMDGVLISSLGSVERSWTRWAEMRGIDPAYALSIVHGRRSIETIARLRPDLDAEAENRIIEKLEIDDREGVTALPGVLDLLAALPAGTWTVVTSATGALARVRLAAAGIPACGPIITADDVVKGKPDPAPYLAGAALLGLPPAECVVVEDAASGVKAGPRRRMHGGCDYFFAFDRVARRGALHCAGLDRSACWSAAGRGH